jgi:glycosyltransferase involved in cell wall biosynthesis
MLGLVIPTRNNPKGLVRTLTALVSQTNKEFSVVVVSSGDDVRHLIQTFKHTLRISHYHSDQRGQIHQRNLGINIFLEEYFRYIGFWDDDLEAEVNCMAEVLEFIGRKEVQGQHDFAVGLNIVNEKNVSQLPFLKLQRMLKRVGDKAGQVTVAGMATPITNVAANVRVQWVGGGYTFWSANILRKYPQRPMRTRHAAGEDLIYSYPLGKIYPLFVCAKAKVVHDDSGIRNPEVIRFRAERTTITYLFFCDQHEELSRTSYLLFQTIFQISLLLIPKRNAWRKLTGFLSGVRRYYCSSDKGPTVLDDENFDSGEV